jgi:hypothetical protein
MKRTNERFIYIKQKGVKKNKICSTCGKSWKFRLEEWKEDDIKKCRHDEI